MFAGLHAQGADAVACTGMLSTAVLCAADARVAERREWVLNEKRLVERAAFHEAQALLGHAGAGEPALAATVSAVSTALWRPAADRALTHE